MKIIPESISCIITGSNPKLLSGEFGTYLAGRSHELTVYPLSLYEYLTFVKEQGRDGNFSEVNKKRRTLSRSPFLLTKLK